MQREELKQLRRSLKRKKNIKGKRVKTKFLTKMRQVMKRQNKNVKIKVVLPMHQWQLQEEELQG